MKKTKGGSLEEEHIVFWRKFSKTSDALDKVIKMILYCGNNIKKGIFECVRPIGVCNLFILIDCSLSKRDLQNKYGHISFNFNKI